MTFDGDMYDFFLPNGLKVILMEKHSAPKVAVSVFYDVGSRNEPDGQKGINQLIQNAMLQGTEKYPSEFRQKKRDEFDANYGDYASIDITYFWTEIQVEQLELLLDLESDRMVNVNIDADMLSVIKDQYKTDLDEFNTNELDVAFSTAMSNIMPDGHPYKTKKRGIPEQVDTLSINTCNKWYKDNYAPNNAVLVIVGDITTLELSKLVFDYFGAIPPSDNLPLDQDLTIKSFQKDLTDNEYNANSQYMRVYGAAVVPLFFMPSARNDDVILLEHLSNIIALATEKRGGLFKKMSKNRRLFIDAEFDFHSNLGTSILPIITINILRKGSIKKISKNILSTFEFIGENGINNKLLEQYKKSELLKEYENNYSYRKIANSLGYAELIMGDYHFYNRKRELLIQLTNDDIKKVAKKYFNKDNMQTIRVVINKKTWLTPFASFLANHILLRFWDPSG